uniref:Uncharacterized protein n=1 Tax=Fagus sylvatica TaxID=28930 RepID=A0A2N9F1I5_FAGSY
MDGTVAVAAAAWSSAFRLGRCLVGFGGKVFELWSEWGFCIWV